MKKFEFTPKANFVYENYKPKVVAPEIEIEENYQKDVLDDDVLVMSVDRPSTSVNKTINIHVNFIKINCKKLPKK